MKVLQIIWANPGWHPAFVFTSQLCAEQSSRVYILGQTPDAVNRLPGPVNFGSNVRIEHVSHVQSGWRNKLGYLRFIQRALILVKRLKPDVIIGYDLHGFVAAYLASRRSPHAKLIYHNFDLLPSQGLSYFYCLLKKIEIAGAHHANQVIVSSPGRAAAFKAEAKLLCEPIVVMNCQRLRQQEHKTGELLQLLQSKGLKFDRIVTRLGMLAPHNAVETTIQSVPHWKGNWGLVLGGVAYGRFLKEMQQLVANLKLEKRVIFLPSIPYALWYDCLYTADLGMALYQPVNINNENMAGAGNKLNLYLKAGIPSIVPNLPDFVNFAQRYKASEIAEAADPLSIANAVNAVLSDADKYKFYSSNAQQAFETEFNFEKQFDPILKQIFSVTS